jgi:GNAT superfamily N-acetyltransferase
MTDRQPRTGVPSDAVLDPLCGAFSDYPVMRYVLGPGGDYGARLHTLIGFFLVARTIRKDPILATYDGGEVSGVAICTLPGLPGTPDLEEARDWTWAKLGADARDRYGQWIRVWEPLGVTEPNIHVNMLGVPPRFQGRGLGRVLLEGVQAMSREHPDSRGISLTTESAANVPFYQHLGYRLLGHGRIGPGLESWGFFRPD